MGPGNRSSFLYCDLFAGVGGFAAALNSQGGVLYRAFEIDQHASNVYKRNFGHDSLGNVRTAAEGAAELDDFDIITGGFPCQPFSKSGSQRGASEERGTLFDSIAEIIKVRKPTVVLLENVRNLAGPRHRAEWLRIVAVLRSIGYRISDTPAEMSPHVLPKNLGGRPQHRVRIFITATYNPGPDGANEERPLPVAALQDFPSQNWNILSDLPLESNPGNNYLMTKEETRWLEVWEQLVQGLFELNQKNPPSFPLWSDVWTPGLPDNFADYPEWKKKIVIKNHQFYIDHQPMLDKWISSSRVRLFPASRRKFEWQAGQLKSVWDCLIQFRPSGIRVKAPTYVPALVALNQTSVYAPLKRRLTEREVARLQGFPEGFDFGDQEPARTYRQMGNAVNVGVVAYILRKHVERDLEVLSKTEKGANIIRALQSSNPNPDDVFDLWKGMPSSVR